MVTHSNNDRENNPLEGFLEYFRNGGFRRQLSLSHLSEYERRHLFRVHAILLSGVFATTLGVLSGGFAMSTGMIGPAFLSLLSTLTAIGASIYISHQRAVNISSGSDKSSTGSLMAFEGASFSVGMSISSLVLLAAFQYTNLLITAITGSLSIFLTLTIASLFARRRATLWIGSILGSIMSYMFFASLTNLFLRSPALNNILAIGGVITGAGYTLVDTQMMLENAAYGEASVVHDALTLYMDLIRIFIHLLSYMMDREEDRDRRRRKRN